MSTSVSIRLPDHIAKTLEELARATDRPKTYFIEKALESYLAEYADYQVALDRLRDKDDPIISAAELRKRVGRRRKD
jgi:RHH-type rel operon transcriptional repressor/antitoxin RelB